MTLNKVIGVTGNSGSGKGTVCTILQNMGGFCIDADQLAHQVMEYGHSAYTEISEMFGAGILASDGSIDRRKLGDIVFHDPVKRKALEHIVHTHLKLKFRRLTDAALEKKAAFVVWDAPLLAEADMHKSCNLVLLVTAPFITKIKRITNRDGISEEQALLRLSNQPADDELYHKLIADIGETHVKIIENIGSISDLEDKIYLAVCGD